MDIQRGASPTVGVEHEFLVVDDTGYPSYQGAELTSANDEQAAGELQPELVRCQAETTTSVCQDAEEATAPPGSAPRTARRCGRSPRQLKGLLAPMRGNRSVAEASTNGHHLAASASASVAGTEESGMPELSDVEGFRRVLAERGAF
jgi:hypothetical protein